MEIIFETTELTSASLNTMLTCEQFACHGPSSPFFTPISALGFSILIGSGTCNFSLYSHLADLTTWHIHYLAIYQPHKHWRGGGSRWKVSPLLQPSWVWKYFEIFSNKRTGKQFSRLMGALLCSCVRERIVVCKFTCTP